MTSVLCRSQHLDRPISDCQADFTMVTPVWRLVKNFIPKSRQHCSDDFGRAARIAYNAPVVPATALVRRTLKRTLIVTMPDQRTDYSRFVLREQDVDPDAICQFVRWFDEATKSTTPEPHAMTLATATRDGRPSARIVLLRGVDERGFAFFTNYESRKGRELDENPWAALVFFWHDLERQVRIEGRVERVDAAESDVYFHSRPTSSRIGAWASPQSQVIESRDVLLERCRQWTDRFADGAIAARLIGAGTGSSRMRSSSGKDGPAGCTTGCDIREEIAVPVG